METAVYWNENDDLLETVKWRKPIILNENRDENKWLYLNLIFGLILKFILEFIEIYLIIEIASEITFAISTIILFIK